MCGGERQTYIETDRQRDRLWGTLMAGVDDINTMIDSLGTGSSSMSWHTWKIGSEEQMVRRRNHA